MTNQLANIKNFDQLIRYLEDELEWPCQEYGFDEITFKYTPEELGIKDEDSVQIKQIHQLRPFYQGQPWGIFFIEFEKKHLPVALLRRVLSHLVVKKRASANSADKAVWNMDNLLFISAFGDASADTREIAFAHFHQEVGDLPTLKVLGWDGADTVLKMEFVDQELHEKLHWPKNPKNEEAWQSTWSSAFRHKPGFVIRTANALAERLAELARGIRGAAETLMAHESEKGPLRQLYKAFQTALIHDLTEADFADTYAQTITYGLLTAAISRTDMSAGTHGTSLVASNVTDMVPITNPFLKEMLETFIHAGDQKGGIQFDELGIQDVVNLLRGEETDLPAVLRDFDNKTPGEDPVIQFYEHFLAAYNKKLKVQRGVFYTPKPVVSYIVRSVHELLQTEFGLEDGLADTTTWGEMEKKLPGLKRPESTSPDSPFVMILDPATGTATFLVEVIDVIFKTLTNKWEKMHLNKTAQIDTWNEYVPNHLLPRVFGFELMMAPYAIAHMKIGLKLFETGYRFSSPERVRIFLTNSLEPASTGEIQQKFAEMSPALAHEAKAVNEVKQNARFTIVIGNPPYSYMTANLTETSKEFVEQFRFIDGKKIKEKGALILERALQDDYVKFFGFTFRQLNLTGLGIIGMISNRAYLSGPQLRGVRYYISQFFDHFRILDLHGDSKNLQNNDKNIFAIRTGVAIFIAEKITRNHVFDFSVTDLFGTISQKEIFLNNSTIKKDSKSMFVPTSPQYLFRPSIDCEEEYKSYIPISNMFDITSVGIKTNRDNLSIGFNTEEIKSKLDIFNDQNLTTEQVKRILSVQDDAQWSVEKGRSQFRATYNDTNFNELDFRPFDVREIYYHSSIVAAPRPNVMSNMAGQKNIALLTNRKIRTPKHCHFFVTNKLCMSEFLSSADNCNVYPLWIFEDTLFIENKKRPNLNKMFVRQFASRLNVNGFDKDGFSTEFSPENIFNYIYSIFHSCTYREKYAKLLLEDFPRIPLTTSISLFNSLSLLGRELIEVHLLESPSVKNVSSTFGVKTGDYFVNVGYPKYWANRVLINPSQGFDNISIDIWEFQIGKYQVCHKWLKDRRGRQLSEEDIIHYQKIIVALKETIRIMSEIDQVIESHGGWPIR